MEKQKSINGIFYVAISLLAVLAVGAGVYAYANSVQNINVSGDYVYNEAPSAENVISDNLAGFPGNIFTEEVDFAGLVQQITANDLANNTTTVLAVKNPWAATSTIDFFRVFATDATTTAIMNCATSSTPYKDGMGGGDNIIKNVSIATSTGVHLVAGCNSTAQCDTASGIANTQWEVGAAEYVVCTETTQSTTLYDGAFTDPATNKAKGDYKIRWLK